MPQRRPGGQGDVPGPLLDGLLLQPGQRVLELGTGAGWNAGLLASRAGPDRVTTVEVEPGLAESAAERLRAAGLGVRVVVGQGDRGRGRPELRTTG